MKVQITRISYKFDNGYNEPRSHVQLGYVTSGARFTGSTPIDITNEQYDAAAGDNDKLKALIVDGLIEEAGTYVNELQDYKDTLNE